MSIPPEVIAAVHARANGYCEACGWHLGAEGGVFHHRKLRKQGGLDDADNLVEIHPVCHNGHTNSIHSKVQRSLRLHHLVSAYDDPALSTAIVTPNLMNLKD